MAKKIYAVKKGRTEGLFGTWEECKAQVLGFPGAQYKSFSTVKEARDYLGGTQEKAESFSSGKPTGEEQKEEKEDACVAYVDGSFDVKSKAYSYGCVLLYQGRREEKSQAFFHQEDADMRNVAGELEGAMAAMRFCQEKNIPLLHLYYDYQGIESWALGDWKRNKPGTIRYKQFYDSLKGLQVVFHKVKGHSGVELNEEADRLAKAALGIF